MASKDLTQSSSLTPQAANAWRVPAKACLWGEKA